MPFQVWLEFQIQEKYTEPRGFAFSAADIETTSQTTRSQLLNLISYRNEK